jgi:mono/diheme cytochrome c family protein
VIKAIKVLLFLILLAVIAAVGFVYSGVYDIAADTPHHAITRWLLHTTMNRSVARRAAEISAPANLNDAAMIRSGAGHYAQMCVDCHLAPGLESTELREGLNPQPPELAYEVADMSPAELFWITKHGVKMSAMPAWGKSHTDTDIWAMVAFMQKLPRMSPTQYKELTATPAGQQAAQGHGEHRHGTDGKQAE